MDYFAFIGVRQTNVNISYLQSSLNCQLASFTTPKSLELLIVYFCSQLKGYKSSVKRIILLKMSADSTTNKQLH